MNQNIVDGFIKKATAAGLTQAQAEQFLVENVPGYKTAEQQYDELMTGIISGAGVEKTAKSVAYAEGFLKEAISRGVSDEQAIELTKSALSNTQFKKVAVTNTIPQNKIASDRLAHYADGFMKRAQEVGYTEGQSLDLLKVALAKIEGQQQPIEKKANPELEQILQYLSNPTVAGGLGGAAIGGLGGAALSDPSAQGGHPGTNALLGALLGGGLGAGGGEMYKQLGASGGAGAGPSGPPPEQLTSQFKGALPAAPPQASAGMFSGK